MNKSILIAIIILAGIFLTSIFYFFYTKNNGVPGIENSRNFFERLFPFGGSGTNTGTPTENIPGGNASSTIGTIPQLRKVSAEPVAGGIIFDNGSSTIIRFIERATGHIYETEADELTQVRLSNTTIPRVQEAKWFANGTSLIIRYLKEDDITIETFLATIATTSTVHTNPQETEEEVSGSLEGIFLPRNIRDIALSRDEKNEKIFYLTDSGNGAVGVTASQSGSAKTEIFSSPFAQWNTLWQGSTILLTTKPSASAGGITLSLNTTSKATAKILGPLRGLTILPDGRGRFILFSTVVGNTMTLNVYDGKDGSRRVLPLSTLPEKCVWSTVEEDALFCGAPLFIESGEPDLWYQGATSFADDVWKLKVTDGITELVASPSDLVGVEIDMTNLFLNKSGKYLLFTNKKDQSLWNLNLTDVP